MSLNIIDMWRNPGVKFCFMDTETNGLNLLTSQAYQLSYIIVQGGRVIESVDRHIYHDNFYMPAAAQMVNRFNYNTYKAFAEPLADVMKEFQDKSKGAIMVGHNVLNFDIYMLNALFIKAGIDHDYWFMERIIDTCALSKSYLTKRKNNQFEDWAEFLFWQASSLSIREKGLKSSQGFMLKHFDIPFDKDKLHEALYDVGKNKEVFEKLLFALKI